MLLAEILLRRTRAAQVADIFAAVIRELPDPRSAARKRVATLRRLIRPAGLISRAEQIREIARVVVARHGGEIPRSEAQLLLLPGVGPYVAGAIAAHDGADVVLVDTNTIRVATRLAGIHLGSGDHRRKAGVRAAVHELYGGPVDRLLWWATFDLAALVCTPTKPRCGECPLERGCVYASIESSSVDGTIAL